MVGRGRAGQGRAGQGRAGQGRAGRGGVGWGGQGRAGQGRVGQMGGVERGGTERGTELGGEGQGARLGRLEGRDVNAATLDELCLATTCSVSCLRKKYRSNLRSLATLKFRHINHQCRLFMSLCASHSVPLS